MATRMQQRKGTEAQWISTNGGNGPVLNAGEIGFETDTNKFKIGDGINHWVDLNYFLDAEALGGNIDDYIPLTQRGTAGGVATLNGDGVIPSEQIPSLVGLDTEIASAVSTAVSNLVDSAPGALNTLNELAAAIGDDANYASTVTNALADKAPKNNPTFTGTVAGITKAMVGLENVNNSSDADKPVSTATQTALDLKAPLANPTFTGTVSGVTKAMVGLSDVDNTSDADKPVSDATATALNLKQDASTAAASAVESVFNKLTDGTGIDITQDPTTKAITIAVDSTIATESYVDTEIGNIDALPSQATNNGKFLTTDGSVASWATVDLSTKQDVVSGVSSTEIGYLDGVTSAIQTQLNDKLNSSTAGTTYQTLVSGVSNTEIGYLDGVTSAIQTQINDANTSIDAKLPKAGGTMTGAITLHADPSSSLHAATKQYVDNTASGVIAKPQVLGATTANIDATYSNGTAGVGATLTHNTDGGFPATAGGAEGWAVGKGILVKNQTNKAQNGRYYISDMGSVTTPYVLTRCGYCDEASEIPGAYIFVQDGTNAGTGWIQVVADPATFVVGTDNIDVFQFSGSGTITAGNGISVSGNEVSIDTAVTQARVENVSDTEIGYLNGVTSAIQTQIDAKVNSLVSLNPQTSNYTLVLADAEKIVEMNIGSANTLTVPANSGVAIPVGTRIHVVQTGSGQTTITPAGGVNINGTPGLKTRAQWSAVTLVKRGTDTWVAFGDLTA
jgi:hypothetical protein